MQAWSDFCVLVPLRELKAIAKDVEEDGGKGEYTDSLWFHHGRENLSEFNERLMKQHAAGTLLQFSAYWGWIACRIGLSQDDGMVSVSLPGLEQPLAVPAGMAFRSKDFSNELERRAGLPPALPSADEAPGFTEKQQHYGLRRDLATVRMVLDILDGNPPVETLLEKRLKRQVRDRERREVAHVKQMPSGLEEMLKWTRTPRRNARRGTALPPVDGVRGELLPTGTVRLTARLGPDCRRMLHGKPKPSSVPRLTGTVSQPPLPWEERAFDLDKQPTALELAQGLLAMCADIDLDFHRSATAAAAEMMQAGHFTGTIQGLHRLRGGQGPCGQQDRARYARHLEIMKRLEVEVDMPDGRGILAIPFAAGGARVLDPVTRVPMAANFHAVPDSLVGLMLAEGGHRWQYWLDTRVLRLEDDLAYSLHHVFARQWAARMTRHAVEGDTRPAWNLSTVLDATALHDTWKKRMAKQGKPWLRKRVEAALAELNRIGLFGAAGTATVEWNAEDITASKVLFGEPPPHILEAHADRNSRRIEGARKKRLRLDHAAPGRVGKGGGQGRKGKNIG